MDKYVFHKNLYTWTILGAQANGKVEGATQIAPLRSGDLSPHSKTFREIFLSLIFHKLLLPDLTTNEK